MSHCKGCNTAVVSEEDFYIQQLLVSLRDQITLLEEKLKEAQEEHRRLIDIICEQGNAVQIFATEFQEFDYRRR